METAIKMRPHRREEWVQRPTEGEKCDEGNRELHVERAEVEVVNGCKQKRNKIGRESDLS